MPTARPLVFLMMMKSFLLFLFLTLFCAVPSFAQRTISPSSQAYAQQAQMMREIQYSIQALSERMGALEQQNAALASRISALERGGNAATKDDLAALRADLAAVKNDQGKIREEIIADLTGKIKTLADKQRAEAAAAEKAAEKAHLTEDNESCHISCAMPIFTEGDVIGCVMSLAGDGTKGESLGYETEAKLIQTAASFLGKQLEA